MPENKNITNESGDKNSKLLAHARKILGLAQRISSDYTNKAIPRDQAINHTCLVHVAIELLLHIDKPCAERSQLLADCYQEDVLNEEDEDKAIREKLIAHHKNSYKQEKDDEAKIDENPDEDTTIDNALVDAGKETKIFIRSKFNIYKKLYTKETVIKIKYCSPEIIVDRLKANLTKHWGDDFIKKHQDKITKLLAFVTEKIVSTESLHILRTRYRYLYFLIDEKGTDFGRELKNNVYAFLKSIWTIANDLDRIDDRFYSCFFCADAVSRIKIIKMCATENSFHEYIRLIDDRIANKYNFKDTLKEIRESFFKMTMNTKHDLYFKCYMRFLNEFANLKRHIDIIDFLKNNKSDADLTSLEQSVYAIVTRVSSKTTRLDLHRLFNRLIPGFQLEVKNTVRTNSGTYVDPSRPITKTQSSVESKHSQRRTSASVISPRKQNDVSGNEYPDLPAINNSTPGTSGLSLQSEPQPSSSSVGQANTTPLQFAEISCEQKNHSSGHNFMTLYPTKENPVNNRQLNNGRLELLSEKRHSSKASTVVATPVQYRYASEINDENGLLPHQEYARRHEYQRVDVHGAGDSAGHRWSTWNQNKDESNQMPYRANEYLRQSHTFRDEQHRFSSTPTSNLRKRKRGQSYTGNTQSHISERYDHHDPYIPSSTPTRDYKTGRQHVAYTSHGKPRNQAFHSQTPVDCSSSDHYANQLSGYCYNGTGVLSIHPENFYFDLQAIVVSGSNPNEQKNASPPNYTQSPYLGHQSIRRTHLYEYRQYPSEGLENRQANTGGSVSPQQRHSNSAWYTARTTPKSRASYYPYTQYSSTTHGENYRYQEEKMQTQWSSRLRR